jgi:hypothetical protein
VTGAKIFLLSPASASGLRARQLGAPGARFPAAERFRSGDGVSLEEAFSFMSALYFRGKAAYARRFAAPPPELAGEGILIIAPGFGLVAPEWRLDRGRLRRLARTPVDTACKAYVSAMRRDLAGLRERLPASTQVVILGSIATGKYLDLLAPALGGRLLFPLAFVGAGNMQRGALLLRAARSGQELDYAVIASPRRRPRAAAAAERASGARSSPD